MQECFAYNVITMRATPVSMQTPSYPNCSPSKKHASEDPEMKAVWLLLARNTSTVRTMSM